MNTSSPSGRVSKPMVIHPSGNEAEVHVSELREGWAITSFGTFRRVGDEWQWVGDKRTKLILDRVSKQEEKI